MKKRNLLLIMVFMSFALKGVSQIRDITFTVSPLIEHTWWDKNLTLDNSTFWGGRVGFGFGPLFEIRGFYQKSLDVEASLRDINWQVTDNWADKMTNSYVDISRYGGELKLNLVKNTFFAPYITAGAGVQTMKYQLASATDPTVMTDMKEEQLFGAVGLGTKFNITDRIVLSLEAKNTFFNVNEQSYYLQPDFVLADNNKRLYNWSALASLDFYLGGINNENATAVERAYANMFTDGFRGMKFVIEPGGAYVNFNDDSKFVDQYFLGGSAGFDFSSLVGIRGFYYQATKEPDKISIDFNDQMAMYGGNIIARLNYPRGVNPYLILGGGYLKVGDQYVDKFGLNTAESTPFALGGVGMEIPLSNYIALYGSINAMLTSQSAVDIADVQTPSQVKTSTMYQAGVRFNIGAANDAQAVYRNTLSQAVQDERDINNQRINELKAEYEQTNNQKLEEMRAEYEARIDRLNAELDQANELRDTQRANDILVEKKRAERILNDMDYTNAPTGKLIRMSSDDFERLVDRILREVRQENYQYQPGQYYNNSQQLTPLEERLLQQLNSNNNQTTGVQPLSANDAILSDRLSELNQKLDRNYDRMNQLEANQASQGQSSVIITDRGTAQQPIIAAGATNPQTMVSTDRKGRTRFFKLNRVGLYTGLGFGDMTALNVGVRGYMQISDTPLDFVPEFYAALGDKNGVGLSGNVVYNFNYLFGKILNPYVGLGLGVFPGETTHFGSNIILGTSLDILGGNLFVDYSARSLFKQNQIAVGYRFVF